ncbi:MAG: cytochrome P450 [Pseudomonadota bacterium]
MSEAFRYPDPSEYPSDIPDPYSLELEQIDLSNPDLFQQDLQWAYFKRLRDEAPVHYCPDSEFGSFWSVTRYRDIFSVDNNHTDFSSGEGITLGPPKSVSQEQQLKTPMFIAMDPPVHDVQRATVAPVVAPRNLAALESTIRERAAAILDGLPAGETFNWVDRVSINLTTQMLATLFDFPFEDRAKLTWWSDVATTAPGPGGLVESIEERRDVLMECLAYFTRLWNERVNAPPRNDLISMLAHGENTRHMQPMEFLGNLILLIVGGNDTTRNSISGGVLALNQHPAQYDLLRAKPELIGNMVSEIIRWQTPLAYMRRTTIRDVEVNGTTIPAGEKVLMWYLSGNRDDREVDHPNAFQIDRPNARRHLAFGFGIHRCMGNRLAEMQLRVLWEEIHKRFEFVEVVGAPVRTRSAFVHGYTSLPVRVHPKVGS